MGFKSIVMEYIYLHFGLHQLYNYTFKILKYKWRPPVVTKTGGLYRGKITKISGQNSDGDIVLRTEALNIREDPCP